jgi:hydroxymethylglutaryl-CoA reductase
MRTPPKHARPAPLPAPLPVPAPGEWSLEAHHERIAFLAARGQRIRSLAGLAPAPDPAELRGRTENYIGMTQIPTGLIGPLRIGGHGGSADLYVPLATTVGELVASYDRGARLLAAAGGASCAATGTPVPGSDAVRVLEAQAEVTLPPALIDGWLRAPLETQRARWHLGAPSGLASVAWTAEAYLVEGLSALFLACGQDVASAREVCLELAPLQVTSGGGLRCGLRLDGLMLAARGGGAELPTARECLAILGCEGEDADERLAEVCAALALAGSLACLAAAGGEA